MSNRHFYIKSLHIKNFKGFKDLELKNLRQVNLIGGLNAVGKTALLEAIFVFCERKNPAAFTRSFSFRNLPFDFIEQFKDIFFRFDTSHPVTIEIDSVMGDEKYSISHSDRLPTYQNIDVSAGAPQQTSPISGMPGLQVKFQSKQGRDEFDVSGNGGQVGAHVVMSSSPPPPTAFMFTSLTRMNHIDNIKIFSSAVRANHKERLIKIMKMIVPSISDVAILETSGQSVINVDVGLKKLVPLISLGEGVYFSLIIASAIVAHPNGILLLDEFDGSIHYSKLKEFWSDIGTLAFEFDCQVFATSHSLESIRAAVEGFKEKKGLENLLYIRLDKIGDQVVAENYEPNLLSSAVDLKWEIR